MLIDMLLAVYVRFTLYLRFKSLYILRTWKPMEMINIHTHYTIYLLRLFSWQRAKKILSSDARQNVHEHLLLRVV